jgi:acetylornithine deacetylase/succinyl-diaminopimelate desuccinylase-like protein
MIPGFTDSAAYATLGSTCYGFSPVKIPPGMSYTEMYHGHDERIPIAGLAWGVEVLDAVVREISAPPR